MRSCELLDDKYILFKNSFNDEVYWKEDACGYTAYFTEAGVFTKEQVYRFGVTVLAYHEVKEGKHRKRTHYATTLKDAIKLLR